jgi:putative cardiolipin synthase
MASFDNYWNSDPAYPGRAVMGNLSEEKGLKILDDFKEILLTDERIWEQMDLSTKPLDWSTEWKTVQDDLIPGKAIYMEDAPVVRGDRGKRLVDLLNENARFGSKDTCFVSPYLIPPQSLIEEIETAVGDGSKVRILTASLGANNHTMANSHYKKYRKPLLRAGAELFEFKAQPGPEMRSRSDSPVVRADFISLHIKAFAVDSRFLYLGSLNMDPRSLVINTEGMLCIDSPDLANRFLDEVAIMMQPQNSWSVSLDADGDVFWTSGDEVQYQQPARSGGQRFADWFFRLLPIEDQL